MKNETQGASTSDVLTTDVAIVGGGMVGLTLALLLVKNLREINSRRINNNAPLRIALLDNFALPDNNQAIYHSSFDARSTAVAISSCDILEDAGVWPVLARHATPIKQVHVSDRGHFAGALLSADEYDLSALGYVIENAWLGNVLAAAVKQQSQIDCWMPGAVKNLRANGDGYRLDVEYQGKYLQLQTPLAILADGADSQLRRQLGIGVNQCGYEQSAVIANVQCERPHRGVAYERFTVDGPLAMLPLGESVHGRTCALVWTHPSEQLETVMGWAEPRFLSELQHRFGFRLGRLLRVSRRFSYPLQLQVAAEQVRRGLAVVGNAAHFLHPVAGQGFNLALRDCAGLVAALAEAWRQGRSLGDVAALESYLENQQRDQWATIQMSDRLVRLFSNKQFAWSLMRQLGLLALDALPPAKRLFARQAMGLS